MSTRRVALSESVSPKDLVNMLIDALPKLKLVDLNKLILFSELEIEYRDDKGLLDDEANQRAN